MQESSRKVAESEITKEDVRTQGVHEIGNR